MAFSTMDSLQSSRLALIRLQQTPSIPPADLLLVHTSTTHSTPRAPLQASSELSKHDVQIKLSSFSRCNCFSSWRDPVSPQRGEKRRREGGRKKEGGMNGGNTHLLFLRGSGKSFWKKDKEKGKKERSGTEKFKYSVDLPLTDLTKLF